MQDNLMVDLRTTANPRAKFDSAQKAWSDHVTECQKCLAKEDCAKRTRLHAIYAVEAEALAQTLRP